MKTLFATILLIVHLFNLAGYAFLFRYLNTSASEQLSQAIDRQEYPEDALLEVKMKLNLPYLTSMSEYERFDGEIEINGKHHKYVKRKVTGDTLYLLCLPDEGRDRLKQAETQFASAANDFDTEGKTDKSSKSPVFNTFQSSISDYTLKAPEQAHQGYLSYYPSLPAIEFTDLQGRPPQGNS